MYKRQVCGDATNVDDVALLMDGLKANLIVTDPPYNVSYQSADGKSIQNDSMADGKFYEFLLAAFRNMAEHLAEGGSAYIFHADTEGLNFRRAFKEAGFHISGVCIWVCLLYTSTPLFLWAAFCPERPPADFEARPAAEVLPEVTGTQLEELTRIYEGCQDDPKNAPWDRLEAFERCPGLTQLLSLIHI